MTLPIAAHDHVHGENPCAFQYGINDTALVSRICIHPQQAVRLLSEQYADGQNVPLGGWGRIVDHEKVLLVFHRSHPSLQSPAWAGTDEMFGLLCEYRPWAEVAFFQMIRDDDLRGLRPMEGPMERT